MRCVLSNATSHALMVAVVTSLQNVPASVVMLYLYVPSNASGHSTLFMASVSLPEEDKKLITLYNVINTFLSFSKIIINAKYYKTYITITLRPGKDYIQKMGEGAKQIKKVEE